MSLLMLLPPLFGLAGLFIAWRVYLMLVAFPEGGDETKNVGAAIGAAAKELLKQEFKMRAQFVSGLSIFILITGLGFGALASFIAGAFASALARYLALVSTNKANTRTIAAIKDEGMSGAFNVAFFHGGAISGLCAASLGLLGLGLVYLLFGGSAESISAVYSFGLGASIVALFSSTAAEKVGTGRDIFGSYCAAMIATIAIVSTFDFEGGVEVLSSGRSVLMFLPLALAALGFVCSLYGIKTVQRLKDSTPSVALVKGHRMSAYSIIVASLLLVVLMGVAMKVWLAVVAGVVGGLLIGRVTQYYATSRAVTRIEQASEEDDVIPGLAAGMESVLAPVLVVGVVLLLSSSSAGLYGVGIAAVGMVSTIGMSMAINAFSPIAHTANKIVASSQSVTANQSDITSLVELRDTTEASSTGFAIGCSALSALAVIVAFVAIMNKTQIDFNVSLSSPVVLFGLLLGGLLPYIVASITMPNTNDLVRMLLPTSIAVIAPIFVGFVLGPDALAGLLMGGFISGVLLALTMANAGRTGSTLLAKQFHCTSGPSMRILIVVMAMMSLTISPIL